MHAYPAFKVGPFPKEQSLLPFLMLSCVLTSLPFQPKLLSTFLKLKKKRAHGSDVLSSGALLECHEMPVW